MANIWDMVGVAVGENRVWAGKPQDLGAGWRGCSGGPWVEWNAGSVCQLEKLHKWAMGGVSHGCKCAWAAWNGNVAWGEYVPTF